MQTTESDFGTQIEDVDAIDAYMRTATAVTQEAHRLRDSYMSWFANASWWDKNMSQSFYDELRSRRNAFNLANTKTPEERASVQEILAYGVTAEEMQGKPRPSVDPKTGAVNSGAKPVPLGTSSGAQPTLRQGSTGAAVKRWQTIIGVTADGNFGPGTAAATKKWQASRGLIADGIVGAKSWAAAGGTAAVLAPADMKTLGQTISETVAAAKAAVVTPATGKLTRNLKLGVRGEDVKQWQAHLGLTPPSGYFDKLTDSKTRAYQTAKGLTADGVVGQKTWAVAFGAAPAPTPFAPAPDKAPAPVFAPPKKKPVVFADSKPKPVAKPAPAKKTAKQKIVESKPVAATAAMMTKLPPAAKTVGGALLAASVGAALLSVIRR